MIAQERAAQHLSPWTAWMIPTAFGLCMIHFGAILLDSTFLFHWQGAKLPAPYDALENAIVLSVIGVAGITPTIRRIFGKWPLEPLMSDANPPRRRRPSGPRKGLDLIAEGVAVRVPPPVPPGLGGGALTRARTDGNPLAMSASHDGGAAANADTRILVALARIEERQNALDAAGQAARHDGKAGLGCGGRRGLGLRLGGAVRRSA